MNSPSEKNTSDSLLQALLEKNTQDLAEIQLKPYTPTVYAIPDTIWTAMVNLLQNAATFQPTLYQKLQPLATWEEVQELAAQIQETQEQTVQKALSLVAQTNRQALSQIQEELEKEQASRETFQQQVGKEQERFTSKLSEEFSAWKNELEDFQQQTERRWRQLRLRFLLGLLLSWALACGALCMKPRIGTPWRMSAGVSLPGSRLRKRATAWIWGSSGMTRCWTTTTCPTRQRAPKKPPPIWRRRWTC